MRHCAVLLCAGLLAVLGADADGARPATEKQFVAAAAGATPSPPIVVTVPPGALYVCVVERNGQRQQTTIDFDPKVGKLCATHPEMGPCQYARNTCRADGGRVFAANGVEITMQTEAEYDRKVMRTRIQ